MTDNERSLLNTLGQEIRDDLARAKRLGRETVNLATVRYYAQRIEELLKSEQEDRK